MLGPTAQAWIRRGVQGWATVCLAVVLAGSTADVHDVWYRALSALATGLPLVVASRGCTRREAEA